MDPSFELLQFLVRSDNRVTVLEALTTDQASSTCSTLQTETGIPRSTVSRILAELGDRALVSRAGYRYEVTPLGRFLVGRLHAVFDAIEAMQRLQTLLGELSDAELDIPFTDTGGSEILTPTSSDPRAPIRRFVDLLQAATHVRLLVPTASPVLFEGTSTSGDGTRTFEVVIPRAVLGVTSDGSIVSRRVRDALVSGDMTVFAYDGAIPYVAGTIDELAAVGLTDTAGTIDGYVITSDESVRSWTATIVEAYQHDASRVVTEDLAS